MSSIADIGSRKEIQQWQNALFITGFMFTASGGAADAAKLRDKNNGQGEKGLPM